MTLLHEVVESTVDRLPVSPAVCTGDLVMSYQELDQAANRVANGLTGFGVRPGDLVAVALPSSPAYVVAILGVLKAGAAYVPLDPAGPVDRNRFILKDSAAKLVLTDEPETFAGTPARTLAAMTGPETRPAGIDIGPADLAYVIYTSGSTGQPKGVAVEHRNVVASIDARFTHYDRAPETYALLFPPAFDGAVGVIYWTLFAGGCLYLPASVGESAAADLLWAGGIGRPVTDICCVPALYQFLLDHADADRLAALRRVIVAAEACRPALTEGHFAKAPQASLHNEYGPTEGTVWATVFDCVAPVPGAMPIGRPIATAGVEVVDENLSPVPDGTVGELVIGGAGVARGYLNSPALTKERFLDGRYRTGDLVRRGPDGLLEFVGRVDDQVKWRGFRIEPAEVEAAIGRLAGIADVAVVVSEVEPPALVAFVQPAAGASISHEALAAALRNELPEFMVPGEIVELATLPRTGNGKVDRAALAGRARPATPAGGEPPGDELEETIRGVVAEVMARSDVPLDIHFFRLGADSLTFMKIAATATRQGVAMSVKDVFRAPTVRRLAALVRGVR